MSKVLVMGGSTFVGSKMAQYLIIGGHVVDILTIGHKEISYNGYRNHIICDRKNEDELKSNLSNIEYDYIVDISAYTKKDVEILINSINKEVVKKYMFISSGAVYKSSDKIINEDYERAENENWGQYGLDKKEAENYIMLSNIPYVIFRPSYIYGEENNLYREGFFFDRLKSKKIVPMPYGNNTVTQFVHVDDLVKCFESAMLSNINNGVYNLSYPEEVTWKNLINACAIAVGEKPIIKKIDTKAYDTRSYFPFRDVTYTLSIEKLKTDDLYIPQISLVEGMKKSYKWYLDNNIKISDSKMTMIEDVCK